MSRLNTLVVQSKISVSWGVAMRLGDLRIRAITCVIFLAGGSAAFAQDAPREPVNPPQIDKKAAEARALRAAPPSGSGIAKSERVLDLAVTYTDSQLFNPATGKYDKVRLRSYQGPDINPAAPYVSPTIEIVPGETVRLNVDNQLPKDGSCAGSAHDMNTPHCFNGTNIHTHGLWINPAGNSDNVLLSINPGVAFQYEYNVPPDHPSGTFWYHTHRHGSTALQVSSGMAGALIIRGDRVPTPTANGDIDILTSGLKERVLVLQQIQYACRDANGQIKTYPDKKRYLCDPGDVGGIEGYDQFGPGTWPSSGRYTSVNGEVLPTFKAVQGQVERWRMIHAGVRDTISLQFFRAKPGKLTKGVPLLNAAGDDEKLIDRNCTGEAIPYQLMAADGLTMGAGAETTLATFQPGYRWDALVVFPDLVDDRGIDYCVVDASAPAGGAVPGGAPGGASGRQLLGFVQVTAGDPVSSPRQRVAEVLVAAAERSAMDQRVKSAVVADLRDGLKFTRFVPHADIAAEEVTGQQELTFFIDTSNPSDITFNVGNTLNTADVKPYDPNRIDRALVLGGVDEWTMQSHFVSHPFHIHVNPFQVVSITDPNGKDVSAAGSVDNAGGSVDPQYSGLKGVWKDTLWVKSLLPGSPGIYTVKVRTRYQRYIGEFVLHCHILDHEDQGMMQNVSVVLPTGDGGDDMGGTGHHH